jgi:DNA-binding NtrC family response regulator
MNILVVDDDKDVELLFEQAFKKEISSNFFKFIYKYSTEDAIEYLLTEGAKIAIILSDINLPGQNGFELLKSINKNKVKIPVFMITAFSSEDNKTLAKQLNAYKYLTKPIDFAKLKEDILQIIQNIEK